MIKVTVKAPAKLNLSLDIIGLAPNGYHEVDMIMQTISLFETVEISKSMGYSLRCPGSPVPANDKNTATKAAAAFFKETGLLAGAEVVVHKATPTRAGMGGGSSDAAAVLVGLNKLYGARLTLSELCQIGSQIGADVPFALMGGTARAQGIGEKLTKLANLPHCWFVVAMPPGSGVSTPQAYERYDQIGSPVHPDVSAAAKALQNGSLAQLLPHMSNALETASGNNTTRELKHFFCEHGASASMMTGSGAAVFGLFEQKAEAQQTAGLLRQKMTQVYLAEPVPHGPVIENSY